MSGPGSIGFTSTQLDGALAEAEDGVEPDNYAIDVAVVVDRQLELVGEIEVARLDLS